MKTIEELLRLKLALMRKFLGDSKDFLSNLGENKIDQLQFFENSRSKYLDQLSHFEEELSQRVDQLRKNPSQLENKTLLIDLDFQTKSILEEIILVDQQILEHLNQKRDLMKAQITEIRRGESVVKKFKSSWLPQSGEKLDGSL